MFPHQITSLRSDPSRWSSTQDIVPLCKGGVGVHEFSDLCEKLFFAKCPGLSYPPRVKFFFLLAKKNEILRSAMALLLLFLAQNKNHRKMPVSMMNLL
jgi:hypothetical protein